MLAATLPELVPTAPGEVTPPAETRADGESGAEKPQHAHTVQSAVTWSLWVTDGAWYGPTALGTASALETIDFHTISFAYGIEGDTSGPRGGGSSATAPTLVLTTPSAPPASPVPPPAPGPGTAAASAEVALPPGGPAALSAAVPPARPFAPPEAGSQPTPTVAPAGVPTASPQSAQPGNATAAVRAIPPATPFAQLTQGKPTPDGTGPDRDGPTGAAERLGQTTLAGLTDGALVRRFAAEREQAAFTELVRRHGRSVLNVCTRVLGDPHRAQDASQATFLALARRADGLDDRGSLAGWLYKVAYRVALRHRTAAARQRRIERAAAQAPWDEDDFFDAVDDADVCRALREELARLPEKYRLPLALCYLDGRTHAEVAVAVGLPRGSVAKRIGEALERLRESLAGRGFAL